MFGISAFAQAPFAALGENVTVVALSGVSASGSVGTVLGGQVLTGVTASGVVGSVEGSSTVALSGVAASGSVGTVELIKSFALTGVFATGDVGTVSRGATSFALTGVEASGLVGTMIYNESDATSGDVAIGEVGTVVPSLTVALTGVAASGFAGTVTHGGAAVALTGDEAVGSVGSVGVAVSTALSGVSASGTVGNVIAVYWKLIDDSQTVSWQNVNTDVLIWMDADTICHSRITVEDLDRLCPTQYELCFLGRRKKYSECGLYSMRLGTKGIKRFLKEFRRMYDDADHGIFLLDEWHDSFVFDAVRKNIPGLIEFSWSASLGDLRPSKLNSPGEGHPLINSEWGAYLDHLKVSRKKTGRSLPSDLKVKSFCINRFNDTPITIVRLLNYF